MESKKSKSVSVQDFYKFFAKKNLIDMAVLFTDDVILRDWEFDVCGKQKVLNVFTKIFSSQTEANVNIINYFEIETSAIAEIEISFETLEIIRVIDIFTFDNELKITSIRAYKG
jgi:hypothetical protein